MARYSDEFMGIRGDLRGSRGMDPNFRGGYHGMRMRGDNQQAAYGWHRWSHAEDFQGSGGFLGDNDYSQRSAGQGGYRRPRGEYDQGWSGGGVHENRSDPRALRDFNAYSPAVRYADDYRRARYGGDYGGRQSRGRSPAPGHFQGERFDYANRGLSSSGYAEGWAWGPMRGAR